MPKPDKEQVVMSISGYLVANGFNQIMLNSLTKSALYEGLNEYPQEKMVKILNPLSSDLDCMRQNLVIGGIETIAYNVNRQQYNLRLFEFGKSYQYLAEKIRRILAATMKQTSYCLFLSGTSKKKTGIPPIKRLVSSF
ncbi:MAG: hypothetical protein HC896_05600 [Bacteroidales bacterium]|nr:hypothetical protein [Bacteroidales bacterium]